MEYSTQERNVCDMEVELQVRSRSVALCRVFDLEFNGIHLAQVILKLWVVYGQNIIDVPECEIEPRRLLFPPSYEQRLYKFCFIWVEKYVG